MTRSQLQPGTTSVPSSPSDWIERLVHITYFVVWGGGKQACITWLHCTCRAVCASSWSGKSTSAGGQACRSALYGGGHAGGGRSLYRESFETRCIVRECGATRVRHSLHACWHRWVFDIGFDPAGGLARQEGHNPQVQYLDTSTKNRHAARDDVGHYTPANLHAMLLKPVCNTWSGNLHRVHCNTRTRRQCCV